MTDSSWARTMLQKRAVVEIILAVAVVFFLVWLVRVYTRPIPSAFEVGGQRITLEIADSDAQRQQGLGFRESLNPETGMLFVFRSPGYHSFWMRGMLFPIDIIWLNDDFVVVDVVADVSPDTYPKLFSPERKALYVLEINAGKAGEFGISVNTKLKPLFDN